MISTIVKPFTAIWNALVRYHREHLADDPDVSLLKEQQEDAQRANRRLNEVERQYLRGERHAR